MKRMYGTPVILGCMIAVAGCAAAPQHRSAAEVEAEARGFMESYAADFIAHDVEALIARYHLDGAYFVGHGDKTLLPYDDIAQAYREGPPQGPVLFELHDLSFEVLGEDAVLVVGTFQAQWEPDRPVQVASYTGLLVRQDGMLRIRLEDESFDDARSATCAPAVEDCEAPLDSTEAARYLGEYRAGPRRIRVFQQDGHTLIEAETLPAMRILYDGDGEFRAAVNPSVRIRFGGDGPKATSITVFRGTVIDSGRRVE